MKKLRFTDEMKIGDNNTGHRHCELSYPAQSLIDIENVLLNVMDVVV